MKSASSSSSHHPSPDRPHHYRYTTGRERESGQSALLNFSSWLAKPRVDMYGSNNTLIIWNILTNILWIVCDNYGKYFVFQHHFVIFMNYFGFIVWNLSLNVIFNIFINHDSNRSKIPQYSAALRRFSPTVLVGHSTGCIPYRSRYQMYWHQYGAVYAERFLTVLQGKKRQERNRQIPMRRQLQYALILFLKSGHIGYFPYIFSSKFLFPWSIPSICVYYSELLSVFMLQ